VCDVAGARIGLALGLAVGLYFGGAALFRGGLTWLQIAGRRNVKADASASATFNPPQCTHPPTHPTHPTPLHQSVIEASSLQSYYHISVEFTRALREAAKQLLRREKLPALAVAGDQELWLTWVDGLVGECTRMDGRADGCVWMLGPAFS